MICVIGIVLLAVLLSSLIHNVWQTSGGIVGVLVAAAVLAGVLVPAPLGWLKVMRLFAGIVLAVATALLTLVLGYALEHPTSHDPFLGGLMLATVLAFGVTLSADLRIQTLERRAAEETERAAQARHEELLAAIAAATEARPVGGSTSRAAGSVRAVSVALTVWLLLKRRQRGAR